MKKCLSLFLMIVMLFSLTACHTEDDYSLSNIGKIDDGQRGIPLPYISIMDDEQTFMYDGKSVLLSELLSQYDDVISRYAIVEMDGDNGREFAV